MKRLFFHREKMQRDFRPVGLPPCLPCREKIKPCSEPGLDDGETAGLAPASRQIVAVQENMPGLREGALGRRIDVVERRGVKRAVSIERSRCGNDGLEMGGQGKASMPERIRI